MKQVMLVSEQEQADIPIYGKTGMGKAEGIVVDAWFIGFLQEMAGAKAPAISRLKKYLWLINIKKISYICLT